MPAQKRLIYNVKNYKNIFIGKNTHKYRGLYNELFTGSSILVEAKKNNYVFIGNKIKTFRTIEPVVEFHSIMGNSSVVYPFALTSNYTYLMLYNVYLERRTDDMDPYDGYYRSERSTVKITKNAYDSIIIDEPQ